MICCMVGRLAGSTSRHSRTRSATICGGQERRSRVGRRQEVSLEQTVVAAESEQLATAGHTQTPTTRPQDQVIQGSGHCTPRHPTHLPTAPHARTHLPTHLRGLLWDADVPNLAAHRQLARADLPQDCSRWGEAEGGHSGKETGGRQAARACRRSPTKLQKMGWDGWVIHTHPGWQECPSCCLPSRHQHSSNNALLGNARAQAAGADVRLRCAWSPLPPPATPTHPPHTQCHHLRPPSRRTQAVGVDVRFRSALQADELLGGGPVEGAAVAGNVRVVQDL